MSELFDMPESPAPRIVKLRNLYDKAKSAYDEADAHETGSYGARRVTRKLKTYSRSGL